MLDRTLPPCLLAADIWVRHAVGVMQLEWQFETANEIYPSSLHAEIMALLRREGAADSDFDSAELIYGELISNLIRHARGRVTVRVDWSAEFPTLSVSDEQRYAAPAISLPSDPMAESGRGLFIVKTLAKEFTLRDDGSSGSAACAILPVKRRPA
jgi:anti-sigma regulatory factor (Ser/Thr protein kinase)